MSSKLPQWFHQNVLKVTPVLFHDNVLLFSDKELIDGGCFNTPTANFQLVSCLTLADHTILLYNHFLSARHWSEFLQVRFQLLPNFCWRTWEVSH